MVPCKVSVTEVTASLLMGCVFILHAWCIKLHLCSDSVECFAHLKSQQRRCLLQPVTLSQGLIVHVVVFLLFYSLLVLAKDRSCNCYINEGNLNWFDIILHLSLWECHIFRWCWMQMESGGLFVVPRFPWHFVLLMQPGFMTFVIMLCAVFFCWQMTC